MSYDFNNYENDALTNPRDKAWDNWAKFAAVGDKVQGFIRDVFFRAGEGQFAEQRGLTLEQADGTLINVGIKHIDFVLKQTDGLRLNDPVTIIFEKEIPATVKGHSATKNFAFYGSNLPENEGQKTVAVLEAEDRKIAADVAAVVEDAAPVGETASSTVEVAPANGNSESDLPFESSAPVAEVAAPATPVAETAAPAVETAAPAAPVAPATPAAPVAPKA